MQDESTRIPDPREAMLVQAPEIAALIQVFRHGNFDEAGIRASTFRPEDGDSPDGYRQRLMTTYTHPVQKSLLMLSGR